VEQESDSDLTAAAGMNDDPQADAEFARLSEELVD